MYTIAISGQMSHVQLFIYIENDSYMSCLSFPHICYPYLAEERANVYAKCVENFALSYCLLSSAIIIIIHLCHLPHSLCSGGAVQFFVVDHSDICWLTIIVYILSKQL